MKKILLILLLGVGLVLGIGMNAYAVDFKLYTEKWSGAKYDYQQNYFSSGTTDDFSDSYNVASNFLGFELVARRFYLNIEEGLGGKVKYSNVNQNLEIEDIKFGCRVIRNDVCTLDIFNGLLFTDGIRTYDSDDFFDYDYAFGSTTLGGNLNLYIGDNFRLQGCIEVPLEGYVSAYKLKASFLVTPEFGLTVGYRDYKITDDDEDVISYYGKNYKNSSTSKLKGLTLGIELNF